MKLTCIFEVNILIMSKDIEKAIDLFLELHDSDEKLKRKDNIITKLLFDKNENELIETFDFLNQELNNKGYLLNLEKYDILSIAKKRFNTLGDRKKEIWSKDVAIKFGYILKKIKKLLFFKKKVVDYNDIFYKGVKILIFGKNFLLPELNNVISNKINIKLLSIGGYHTIILSQDGNVYTCGKNGFGQLGLGDNEERSHFQLVRSLKNKCTFICAGYAYSSIIIDKKIYSCGAGENGRLGNLSIKDSSIFSECAISDEVDFYKVQCGSVHQVALTTENILYSCGNSDYTGHKKKKLSKRQRLIGISFLKRIDELMNIKFVQISIYSCGYHTLALTASGLLYSWGHNRVGQLGLGHNKLKVYEPSLVKSLSDKSIKYISAGWGHSAVLDINNHLYMCGRNTSGQISFDENICLMNKEDQIYNPYFTRFTNHNVKLVRCGYDQTNIITVNDTLFAFGNNDEGKLGCDEDVKKKYEIVENFSNIVDIMSSDKFTIIINEIIL